MRRQAGFTLTEVLIVVLVGSILLGVTLQSLGGVQERLALQQAAGVVESMVARARAMAVETGEPTRLNMHSAGDSLWIVRGGTTVNTVHLEEQLGVDLRFAAGTATLCMGPRGYAEESCTTFTDVLRIELNVPTGDVRTLAVTPTGQILR